MTDIEVLKREIECVRRKGKTNCCDCISCELLMDEETILAAYDHAISALRTREDFRGDLISRKALLNAIRNKELSDVRSIVNNVPSVDAVQTVYAHWDPVFGQIGSSDTPNVIGWTCSECDQEGDQNYNFCPNCGAKIDGVE